MRKSLSKRIRITKRGKILTRVAGVNHFRTRKTQKNIRNMQGTRTLAYPKKGILNLQITRG